jgi:hypothetical protein
MAISRKPLGAPLRRWAPESRVGARLRFNIRCCAIISGLVSLGLYTLAAASLRAEEAAPPEQPEAQPLSISPDAPAAPPQGAPGKPRASRPGKAGRPIAGRRAPTRANTNSNRIMAAIDDINRRPVIHTWSYKLTEVA